MKENQTYCTHCGTKIVNNDYTLVGEDIACPDCTDRFACICEYCGTTIWDSDSYSDDSHTLCQNCYEGHYSSCNECDRIIHNNNAYQYGDDDYCRDCYYELTEKDNSIHDYSYKPDPIFYGDNSRYLGVELEIDVAGKDNEYADEILEIANTSDNCIYIKSDSSLEDGMEIVTHPLTLAFHENYCWSDILRKCVSLGYRSHQTSTCGLHVHVNRNSLGDNRDEQDKTISRILYFVEHHWNEMLRFSRRCEATMNRWAARYGYENTPKAILDKAKKGNIGRYAAVNLCNYNTVEFRMFRGTLKLNTFIAALQLVNEICNVAFSMSDSEMQAIFWSQFVSKLTKPELIQYLKERNIYINEKTNTEEEI